MNTLKQLFFAPLMGFKVRYIPLLLIYFAYGSNAITTVALTFWEKENLALSAEQLVIIGTWLTVPWTIKMIFGQFVDHYPLFGNKRKSYIYLGATLMAIGYIMLYGVATAHPIMQMFGNQFNQYLLVNLVSILGFVIQDVTADAMSTEVVAREGKAESEIQTELTRVQILGRLSLMGAMASVALLGGFLAQTFDYETVFLIALIVPIISVLGATFVKLDDIKTKSYFDPVILGGGIAFAIFTLIMAFTSVPYSQEIVFSVSLCLLSFLLWQLIKHQPKDKIQLIALTLIAIFIFRLIPKGGPGMSWFVIDNFGFDEVFMGVLKQVSSLLALAVLWFGTAFISSQPVRVILIFLIVVQTFFSVPELALYFGWYNWLSLSPEQIALIDSAGDDPLTHISMIPMLAIIAFYAPVNSRATWFAVAASLMNLALTGSQLITKYLYQAFPVERMSENTVADYSMLGNLLIWKTALSFFIPLIAVVVLLYVLPKRLIPSKTEEI